MSAPFSVEIDNRPVLDLVRRVSQAGADLRPAFAEIGEDLRASTLARFATETAPDGRRWAPNTQATLLAYLRAKTGKFDKRTGKRVGAKKGAFFTGGENAGRITSKTAGMMAGKKVLHGLSGILSTDIHYEYDANSLLVGTGREYGAMMQFGGARAQFKNLWGDIPARPFLGISPADETNIIAILSRHLEAAGKPG